MVQPKVDLADVYDSIYRLSMIRENLLAGVLESMPAQPNHGEIGKVQWMLALCDDCLTEEITSLRQSIDKIRLEANCDCS